MQECSVCDGMDDMNGCFAGLCSLGFLILQQRGCEATIVCRGRGRGDVAFKALISLCQMLRRMLKSQLKAFPPSNESN